MDSEKGVIVEIADDWEIYSQAWHSTMRHFYWYQESPVFDFNKDEEIDGMHSDFGKQGNIFLVARAQDHDGIVGVLGLRYGDIMARFRRWEPAVIPELQRTGVAKVMLKQALEHLAAMGVKRAGCLLKHPVNHPQSVTNYLSLYEEAGFGRSRPDSVDMVLSLDDFKNNTDSPNGVHVETGENYTFEDLASITVKSFTSTPEEREIHGFDKTVTEHIQATALLQRMAEGYYGYSSDEFRKIAVIDGIPAGFLGSFIVKSKYKPKTGVLGPLAVLPDYRRRGIALHLVNEVLHTLREFGCEYAAVGTPSANIGAIKMYEKAGFSLANRIINLERGF